VECTFDNAFNLIESIIRHILPCLGTENMQEIENMILIESKINCVLHLLKDQLEDGHAVGPKHVAGILT
jgi:hypothetical protein